MRGKAAVGHQDAVFGQRGVDLMHQARHADGAVGRRQLALHGFAPGVHGLPDFIRIGLAIGLRRLRRHAFAQFFKRGARVAP
ncbi:hypothetical protein D3C71_1318490 [compost metagenome]